MWRPWSRALEALGRLRFPSWQTRRKLTVGVAGGPDAQGGTGWRDYARAERLYDVWGPLPESAWVPYHCVPLFAALDVIDPKKVGPAHAPEQPPPPDAAGAPPAERLPIWARPGASVLAWHTPSTWVILDLPGPAAVEAAAWMVTAAGCQPVCTFDNWPHERGLLRPEQTLAELLRWATTVAEARQRLTPNSPPLWICDSQRLGGSPGRPGEFDNRYYLDDSILPGAGLLRREGISRVVYVTMGGEDGPVLDLEAYFAELLKAGLPVLHAELMTPDAEPRAFAAPSKSRKPPRTGFHRSAAGGFGSDVPEPSSGSSG
jgi:hypothetical protein